MSLKDKLKTMMGIDEEEYEIAADKDNFIRRIRKEMFCRKKRTLKTVRLSNDFLNKKANHLRNSLFVCVNTTKYPLNN